MNVFIITKDLIHNHETNINPAKVLKCRRRIKFLLKYIFRRFKLRYVPSIAKLCVSLLKTRVPPSVDVNLDVQGYFQLPRYIERPGEVIVFRDGYVKHPVKEDIERKLTDFLVSGINTYTKTCSIFDDVMLMLRQTFPAISEHIFARKKGSMAMKKFFDDQGYDVTGVFSNSDNDTSIVLHPDCPDYDRAYRAISDTILHFLHVIHDRCARLLRDELNSVCRNTIDGMNIGHVNAFSFDRNDDIFFNNGIILSNTKKRLRIQRNFIVIPTDNNCFDLIRIKAPFLVNGRIFYAEVLDISFVHRSSRDAPSELNSMQN